MNDILDLINELNAQSEDKSDAYYWDPLSTIIRESIKGRETLGMSQAGLANVMGTKQSAISRFENMGRLPTYDFIARLAISLDHKLGMTLYGDYMALVKPEDQLFVKQESQKLGIDTEQYTQDILDNAICIQKEKNRYHENGNSLGISRALLCAGATNTGSNEAYGTTDNQCSDIIQHQESVYSVA